MRIRVYFKTPDAVERAINEAVAEHMHTVTTEDEEERLHEEDSKRDELEELFKKWFKHGEYVTVEVDAEAKSARVVEEV